jgi:hypothetical protein
VEDGRLPNRLVDSLVNHKLFSELQPWLYKVDKSLKGKEPSYRVEVDPRIPEELLARVVDITVSCAACLLPLQPVRRRKRTNKEGLRVYANAYYIAVTCPLEFNMGCARGDAASLELGRLTDLVPEDVSDASKGDLS